METPAILLCPCCADRTADGKLCERCRRIKEHNEAQRGNMKQIEMLNRAFEIAFGARKGGES